MEPGYVLKNLAYAKNPETQTPRLLSLKLLCDQ